MLKRIGSRWWLILLCMFIVPVLAVVVIGYMNCTTKPLYVGRTTLMEALGPPVKGQPNPNHMRLGNLVSLVTSQKVLSRSAQTLQDLGPKCTPQEILSATSVIPVKDTNIIAIEVTLPDPKDAKVGADVIAAEAKRAYAEFNKPSPGTTATSLRTIDPAFVFPVDQRHALKLLAALIGGLLAGLILGLVLAASIPVPQKEPNLVQ